jgi:release factor glutamine methyltransferase
MLTILSLLNQASQHLCEAGIVSARLDARLLLAHVLQVPFSYLLAHPEQILSVQQQQDFAKLLKRRLAYEPVSRIVGQREFWGLSFSLSAATLDPRPDSETLVEAVLKQIPDRAQPLELLDLGTGTGCLLLALLYELPHATGKGIDISEEAIAVAQQNAQVLHLQGRSHFLQQDWTTPITGSFDWIISNPPYIPSAERENLAPEVRLYDPVQALDGGPDGLQWYRLFAQRFSALLKPGGKIALEVGQGQAEDVQHLFEKSGFTCVEWAKDLAGIKRCGIFIPAKLA